jgi:hypothetical protein
VLSVETKRSIKCRPNLVSSSAKSTRSPSVVVEMSTELVGLNVGGRYDVACPEVNVVRVE